MLSIWKRVKRPFAIAMSITTMLLFVNIIHAVNDVTIDGSLGDWGDETGFYTDPWGDATPNRTDITQYGLAIIDNGTDPESLALVMVTDTYQDTGNPTQDSHKLVFYVGPYEIIVDIQNGCDNINNINVLDFATQTPVAAPVTASAVGIIDPPANAPTDTTPDCALELEFPISSLPLLDENGNNQLLDESFVTNFATRQSGGVGNDNDTNDNNGLTPTAVNLANLTANIAQESTLLWAGSLALLMLLTTLVVVRSRRNHTSL